MGEDVLWLSLLLTAAEAVHQNLQFREPLPALIVGSTCSSGKTAVQFSQRPTKGVANRHDLGPAEIESGRGILVRSSTGTGIAIFDQLTYLCQKILRIPLVDAYLPYEIGDRKAVADFIQKVSEEN